MNLSDPGGQYNPYAAPAPDAVPAAVFDYGGQIPAERLTRLGAFMVDRLLDVACMIPGIVVVVLALVQQDSAHGRHGDDNIVGIAIGCAVIFAMLLPLNVYQWYLITRQGQTLGKKWLGIKIVKLDGSAVDFVSGVVMRNWLVALIGLVPTLGGCFRIVDFLMIFTDERRCLHDQMAGTKVVVAG